MKQQDVVYAFGHIAFSACLSATLQEKLNRELHGKYSIKGKTDIAMHLF